MEQNIPRLVYFLVPAQEFNKTTFFFVILAMVLFFYFILFFAKSSVILRTLKKATLRRVFNVKNNEYVKLTGNAKHIYEPLVAPFSGKPCVYYAIEISSRIGKKSYKILDQEKFQDFFLDDDGHIAIIKPTSSSNKSHAIQNFRTSSNKELSQRIKAFMSEVFPDHDMDSKDSESMLYFRENIIATNDMVAVMGIAQWIEIKTPLDDGKDSKKLEITGNKDQSLLITNDPKVAVGFKTL
ncbi:hypothetical protein [uncultured Algibacter sp.]|uniref:hypothetical protein n=1 Tax=uncultured Algibacter sp. TaxID=298659 RepID=UPI00321652B5